MSRSSIARLLAQRAGINASAIRFYEREGLLTPAERRGGRRLYADDAVRRLELIHVAKQAGFSLDGVQLLLAADDGDETVADVLRPLVDRKLAEVDALIARAETMREWLVKARACRCSTLELCGLFRETVTAGR